jgi:hypothetical protein
MQKRNIFLLLTLFIIAGKAIAGAPPLGKWELLFKDDDGRAAALDVYRETPVILDTKGHIYFLNKEIGMEAKGKWFGEVYENWQRVSGGGVAIDISVDGDGVPWVVGKKSRKVFHLDGDYSGPNRGWIEHPGNGRASKISVSKASGTPYMIGATTGRVFKGTDTGWQAMPTRLLDSKGEPIAGMLQAKDIYAKSYDFGSEESPDLREVVFIINSDDMVYLYSDKDAAWRRLAGDRKAKSVVTSGKYIYIIDLDGQFYGTSLLGADDWAKAADGKGKDLAFSQVSIFQPFVRQGGKPVHSSSHRHIWTIGDDGRVYRAFVAY